MQVKGWSQSDVKRKEIFSSVMECNWKKQWIVRSVQEVNIVHKKGLSGPEGDCNGGYYCILGADRPSPTDGVTGDICPTGAYCPPGSNDTTLCPPGTYNPTQGEN